MIKIAVIGSRGWADRRPIEDELQNWFREYAGCLSIITGMAKGADLIAHNWANERNLPTISFLPDWNRHGKSAGIIRNTDVIRTADVVLAFWDGESRGTQDSINKALSMKKELHVYFQQKEQER